MINDLFNVLSAKKYGHRANGSRKKFSLFRKNVAPEQLSSRTSFQLKGEVLDTSDS